jgi:hypothetical protein
VEEFVAGITKPLIVYLPDTRAVELSPFGIGNLKIGMGVHTYSRPAGRPRVENVGGAEVNAGGTCPGSTDECEDICYAKRISGVVRMIYDGNTGSDVPPLPDECRVLRIHISGDFDSVAYINSWRARLLERPDITAWAYTRSWRVPALLPALEELRALPNFQLFASMDPTCKELPPAGWRRAWIDRSWDRALKSGYPTEERLMFIPLLNGESQVHQDVPRLQVNIEDGTSSYICPEETKHKANCLECGYCFEGQKNDVTFLEH